jgi:hypothetical protein
LVRSPPPSLLLDTLPAPLKHLQEVSLFYFIQVCEVHPIYILMLISFTHLPPSSKYSPYTVPILQFCLLLLIFKSMFQGVSKCISTVSLVYFGPFNLFQCSPLPFSSIHHFSVGFNTHPYILYLHRCYVL